MDVFVAPALHVHLRGESVGGVIVVNIHLTEKHALSGVRCGYSGLEEGRAVEETVDTNFNFDRFSNA